ncbi:hypothetical protein H1R20_g8905, partial [Candolleomyces eurysporus]
MDLTLEEQLAQMGISPEDLQAFVAAKRQKVDFAPPAPPPPQPQEGPRCAPVKVTIENTYKEREYHEQPATFGKGKIHIMRTKMYVADFEKRMEKKFSAETRECSDPEFVVEQLSEHHASSRSVD